MKTPSSINWITAAFSVLLCASASYARISMRLPGTRRGESAIEQLGAQRLLSHPMRVNGVAATLSVHGVDLPPAHARARLLQTLKLAAQTTPAGEALRLEWTHEGRHQTVLMLPMRENQTVILLIDAAADEWKQQHSLPLAPPETDWPLPPQGRLRFSARNDETRTAFSIADSAAEPDVAAEAVAAALLRNGWLPLYEGPAGTLNVFVHRDERIRFLLALPSPQGGSRIALLQRQGQNL